MRNAGEHHLHKQKRVRTHEDSRTLHVRMLDRVMVFVSMIGPIATLPQVYDVFARQSAESLSLSTWTLWTVLSVVWAYYGYVHKEAPILWANLVYIILQSLVVYGILLYS